MNRAESEEMAGRLRDFAGPGLAIIVTADPVPLAPGAPARAGHAVRVGPLAGIYHAPGIGFIVCSVRTDPTPAGGWPKNRRGAETWTPGANPCPDPITAEATAIALYMAGMYIKRFISSDT